MTCLVANSHQPRESLYLTVAAPHTRIDCRLKQANTTLEGVHEHGVHLKVARAAALELEARGGGGEGGDCNRCTDRRRCESMLKSCGGQHSFSSSKTDLSTFSRGHARSNVTVASRTDTAVRGTITIKRLAVTVLTTYSSRPGIALRAAAAARACTATLRASQSAREAATFAG